MGNENQKDKKQVRKEINKSQLEILLKEIFFTAQLNKDRKRGVQLTKEKELLALIRLPANKRNRENEYQKASSIVNDVKSVKAHETLMRYADILKDNSLVIQQSHGDPNKIIDLLPYAESLIWGCNKCNLECGQKFVQFIGETFGLQIQGAMLAGTKVTQDIKDPFDSLLPTERQIKLYLIDFCRQQGIDLAVMNEIGHNISPEALNDAPPKDGGNPGNFGNQNEGWGNNQQGGFPSGQQGGLPNQGHQGNQGWNNQGGFPQQGGWGGPSGPGGFNPNQGSFGQQGGFPQGNQGGFNNNQGQGSFGHQQGPGGFNPNQNGYPQVGFPGQGGPNYSQQGNFQPPNNNFNNQQGFVPSVQPQQPQNTNLQSFQSANNNNFYVPQSQPSHTDNFQKQATNTQPQNQPTQPTQPSNDFGSGAYPNFQKFTENNAGGKPSNDPLDELDLRLKNIKNGL